VYHLEDIRVPWYAHAAPQVGKGNPWYIAVVPKLFRAITQIAVGIVSYYPQYFAVIAHNTEQNCDFGSALPLKDRMLPPAGNLPPVWEPLICSNFDSNN